jgi:transposase-like protein
MPSTLVNLPSLIDDAKCYELVRQHRWPDGVRCPRCDGAKIARDGRDDTQPHRQRYRCAACGARFDDLAGTVLAGHHRRLRVWVLCLHVTIRGRPREAYFTRGRERQMLGSG